MAAPDKITFLINALASASVLVVKAAPPLDLFQLIIKAQLEDKQACKQNADNKVKQGCCLRLAGYGDTERPQRNHALEHKADAYMSQVKF
jgi:hypothetical protein